MNRDLFRGVTRLSLQDRGQAVATPSTKYVAKLV